MTEAIIITIPRGASVFLLEDSEARIEWFKAKITDLTIANTAQEAITTLVNTGPFDFIFLDHDLGLLDCAGYTGGAGNGQEVAKHLAGQGYLGENVVIHSWNPEGAGAMKNLLKYAVAVPFGRFTIFQE